MKIIGFVMCENAFVKRFSFPLLTSFLPACFCEGNSWSWTVWRGSSRSSKCFKCAAEYATGWSQGEISDLISFPVFRFAAESCLAILKTVLKSRVNTSVGSTVTSVVHQPKWTLFREMKCKIFPWKLFSERFPPTWPHRLTSPKG